MTLRDACKPGDHGVDVQALKTALEQARSEDVLLEGLVPEEESEEPEPPPKGQDDPAVGWFRKCEPRKSSDKVDVYYYPPDGVQLRSRPDVRRRVHVFGSNSDTTSEGYPRPYPDSRTSRRPRETSN